MAEPSKPRLSSNFAGWLILLVATIWCLRTLLLGGQVPAFRDGFHFYWPQAIWLDRCYQQAEYFPKWNAHEGLGSSVAAQPTWQIYYPFRVLWLLPRLGLETRQGIYIAFHVVLCAIGVLRSCRVLKLSAAAAWLSALSFTLSCPVMFQVNNLVYLCSAAWLTNSLPAILRLLKLANSAHWSNRWRLIVVATAEIACCGSMMTVCGDPHGAVNLLLVTTMTGLVVACMRLFSQRQTNIHDPSSLHDPQPSAAWISVRVLLSGGALALAALQSFESIRWFQISSRSHASFIARDSFHPGLNSILEDESLQQRTKVFDFSLSPWSLPTFVWPTITGHFQPENSRWVQAVPSESRMWVPSLYFGILPFVLALAGMKGFGEIDPERKFLIWLTVASLLLAMGNYSVVWLLRNCLNPNGTDTSLGLPTDGQGSLYGLLVALLPGYDSFRYPAKWIAWTTAGLALLAGIGLDRLITKSSKRGQNDQKVSNVTNCSLSQQSAVVYRMLRRLPAAIVVASALILSLLLICNASSSFQSTMNGWLTGSYDRLAGGATWRSSFGNVARAFFQPLVVCGLFWIFLRRLKVPNNSNNNDSEPSDVSDPVAARSRLTRLGWLVVLLTTVEMSTLQSIWLVSVAPNKLSNLESPLIQSDASPSDANGQVSLLWANTAKADLAEFSQISDQGFQQALNLQNRYLMGKLCHLHSVGALHASGSIEPKPVLALRRWLQINDSMELEQPKVDAVLAELGVTARLVKNATGEYRWRPVAASGPLVELVELSNHSSSAGQVTWSWRNRQSLQIHCQAQRATNLLVRQLNDGGWKLRAVGAEHSLHIDSGQLMISIPIPAGEHDIVLTR